MAIQNDPRRRLKRHAPSSLACQLGDVLDVSGSGMRVMGKGLKLVKIGQVYPVTLLIAGKSIQVQAQALWKQPSGLLKRQIGFRFVKMKPGLEHAIQSLLEHGFVPETTSDAEATPKTRVGATLDMPNYFNVLGLDHDATPDDIRKAYRSLARRWHPDSNHSAEAAEKFEAIQQAYGVLKDEHQRDALKKMIRRRAAA